MKGAILNIEPPRVWPGAQAMINADRIEQDPGLYTVVDIAVFSDNYLMEQVAYAIARTVERHDVFRWRYGISEDGSISIKVARPLSVARYTKTLMLKSLEANAENDLIKLAQLYVRKGISLVRDPPFLIVLVRLDNAELGAIFLCHHCVMDGISFDLFWKEVRFNLSNNFSILPDCRYRVWTNVVATIGSAPDISEYSSGNIASFVPMRRSLERCLTIIDSTLSDQDLSRHIRDIATTAGTSTEVAYIAAAVSSFSGRMTTRRFVVNVPMTARRSDADFSTIGNFALNAPILFDLDEISDAPQAFITYVKLKIANAAEELSFDPMSTARNIRNIANVDIMQYPCIAITRRESPSGVRRVPLPGHASKFPLTVSIVLGDDFGDCITFNGRHGISSEDRQILRHLLYEAAARLNSEEALPHSPESQIRASNFSSLNSQEPSSTALKQRVNQVAKRTIGRFLSDHEAFMKAAQRSIDLVHFLSELRKELGRTVPAGALFDYPIFADFVAFLEREIGEVPGLEKVSPDCLC